MLGGICSRRSRASDTAMQDGEREKMPKSRAQSDSERAKKNELKTPPFLSALVRGFGGSNFQGQRLVISSSFTPAFKPIEAEGEETEHPLHINALRLFLHPLLSMPSRRR